MDKPCNFNSKRFTLLLKSDYARYKKHITYSLFFTLLCVLMPPWVPMQTPTDGMCFLVLYISGLSLSIQAFADLRIPSKAQLALMLPCSNWERFFSRWILVSIILPLSLLITNWLFSVIMYSLGCFIFDKDFTLMSGFGVGTWRILVNYFILQSLCLAGPLMFKKHWLVKCGLLVFFAFSFLISCNALLIYLNPAKFGEMFLPGSTVSTFYWLGLGLIALAMAYRGLTERQIT